MKKLLDHLDRMRLMEVYAWVIDEAKKHYTDNKFFEVELETLSDEMKKKVGWEKGCVLMHYRLPGYKTNRFDLVDWPENVKTTVRG